MTDLSTPIHALSGHVAALDLAMEWAASYGIALAPIALLVAWLRWHAGLRACLAAGIGATVALAASGAIGMAWDRPRPFVAGNFMPLIAHAADASFPSDHVACLAAMATALWFASRRLGLAAWLLAVVVGVARVYVGVHYVSDVIGGAALGAACGVAAWGVTAPLRGWLALLDARLAALRLRPRFPAPSA